MVMDTIQVRLSHGLVKKIDNLVQTGVYSSRSDVLRDAVRRLVLDKLIGILPDIGDSVKDIRKIRTKLSKEKFGLDEINKLAE
ncbi:ribbon-helix-helix protein, CopG family [Candidatus Woesearchaeota archaeon]|nr:ribbon-helix-helix protein, CopG family [Candidatus Woesearchaeota archaeon]